MEWLVDWGYVGLFIGAFIGATIFPFSSEVVLVALLTQPTVNPTIAIASATLGNWLGGMSSYYVGYLGRWDWIEKYFLIKRERLESQQFRVRRWGSLLALMSWAPVIGDLLAVALGFYRVDVKKTAIYMLIGKCARFILWAAAYYWIEPMI